MLLSVEGTLPLRRRGMPADGQDLRPGATGLRQLLAGGFPKAVSAVVSHAAIVTLHRLQVRSTAPVGELVAERGSRCERPCVVVEQKGHGVTLRHRVERSL